MEKVDIVVTYLNERDREWRESFKYWKKREIESGIAEEGNRQAFGEERTREWDCLKYWFRGIEKNCKWINRVFLIVQNRNHVPEWVDRDNPRLRVVYHEEYIPKELLPTYNAMTIGMYVSNIKDLGERYIMCDDDFYFLNPIQEDQFFKCNKPVHLDNREGYRKYEGKLLEGSDSVFYQILNNNLEFEKRYGKEIKYGFYHLPEARLKSVEQDVLKKYGKEILEHNMPSRFRSKNNLHPSLYVDILKLENNVEWGNPYVNSSYCTLKSSVDYNIYKDKEMVCFNDTEQLDDYEKTKEKFVEFLESIFPNKSSFEK